MVAIPNVKLNSGKEMPLVGFGLWKVPNDVCAEVVYNAIKVGYRLFDGACDYGNEVECGQGVARAIKEGIVKREDLFIVSKLWNTFHDHDRVEPIVRRGLADWGIDYFDLYLIHFPVALEYVDPAVRYPPGWHYDAEGKEMRRSKATIQDTWTAMEKLVDAGLARSIGVSNFQSQLLYDLLRYARIPPATLQVEMHPYNVQQDLVRLCANEGIQLTAYSSLGPASFAEFHFPHADRMTPLLQHPTILDVAKKVGKTAAQVLLRWSTQRGIAVIPKTTSEEQQRQNLDILAWDIAADDLAKITALDLKTRFNEPVNYFPGSTLYIFG